MAIIDADGNAIAGTHTIERNNWGPGLFVDGLVLNASTTIPFETSTLDLGGQRRCLTPLPMHLVFRDGRVVLALAIVRRRRRGTGFELIINALDLPGVALATAFAMPRFGATTSRITGYYPTLAETKNAPARCWRVLLTAEVGERSSLA